ncbi:hypothetical protein [Halorussus pelagicus]|uniref:hypothetical protein n=1 Tax=Halorussus pelagicus TaxID=2505977 RepID=UPI000FFB8462|nr:hypothetical protein [Halorussus pelagicus]
MPRKSIPIDRRTMLKRIGTTAAVGAGLVSTTGGAAATAREKARLVGEYHDERALRSAFERHGRDLRETLVDEGFVPEDFEFRALDVGLDSEVTGLEPTAADSLAGVTAIREEGTTTALATVSASSSTHELALFVQPERETAYALVEPKSGGDRLLVDESGVTPTGCRYQTCGSSCADNYSTLKNYNCDVNCRNCKVYDTECACPD